MRQALSRLPKTELAQALHEEANLNGANLTDVDLGGVNLARCNLSGARFNGANLSGSYLQGALGRRCSFGRAKMHAAALPSASLEGAGFFRADLSSANLSWADLREASLVEANLSEAQLFEATMGGAALTDANLEGARLDSVDLDRAVLQRAQLSNAVLHSATLRHADLFEADLRRADLRAANFSQSNLVGAQFGGAKYDVNTMFPTGFAVDGLGMYFLGPDADLRGIDLDGFELKGQDLSRSNLAQADLVGADLRGADLSAADMTGTRLRRALYDDATRFPAGLDPEAGGAYAVAPGSIIPFAKMQWKHLREAALSGASLTGADLTGADLTAASLNSADLSGADLYTANLTGASLHRANLRDAKARGAILRDADLRRADLRGGDFSWADFAGADLRGAQLAGAVLTEARLRGARYNDDTTFPTSFDPAAERMMGGDGGQSVRASGPADVVAMSPLDVALADARSYVAARRRVALGVATRVRSRVASSRVAVGLGHVAARVLSGPILWVTVSGGATLAIVFLSGMLEDAKSEAGFVPEEMSGGALMASAFSIPGSEPILVASRPSSVLAAGIAEPASGAVAGDSPRVATPPRRVAIAPTHAAAGRASNRVEQRSLLASAVSVPGSGPIDVLAESSFPRPGARVMGPVVVAAPAPVVEGTAVDVPADAVVARVADEGYVASSAPAPAVAPDVIATDDVVAAAAGAEPATSTRTDEALAMAAPASSASDAAPVAVASLTHEDGVAFASEVDPEIATAVEQWRGVWEGRDVEGYAELYHPEVAAARAGVGDTTLSAPRFTKVSLEARAANLFSQYERIRVDVGPLAVERDGDLLVSTFDQDFMAWRLGSDASPAYVDHGRKTLVFARDRSSEWRIVSEQWRPVAH